MEGELERKISPEVSVPQIRALAVLKKSVSELYSEVHTEIIHRYISDKGNIDRWNNLSPESRVENLPAFLDSLKGRWTSDLATSFCPPNLNQKMAENVVLQILKKAVREGDIKSEIADNEYKYRCSIGSFLVGEDIVKKLGQDHFVLYDQERKIYYPTKEGRILLATMGGYASLEQSRGVHGLTKEQRIINAGNAGKKGGSISLQNKVGIHAYTIEERRQFGKLATQARGMIAWSDESVAYLISLLADSVYRFPEGSNHRGLPNWKKITEDLNAKCNMNRTVRAVRLTCRRISHY